MSIPVLSARSCYIVTNGQHKGTFFFTRALFFSVKKKVFGLFFSLVRNRWSNYYHFIIIPTKRACGGLSGVFLKVKRLRITKIPRLRMAQREQLAHVIEIYSGFSTHTKCRVKKVSGLMLTIATNTSQTYLYPQRSYCKWGKYYRILVHTLKTSKTGVFNVIKGVNSPPQARKKMGFLHKGGGSKDMGWCDCQPRQKPEGSEAYPFRGPSLTHH